MCKVDAKLYVTEHFFIFDILLSHFATVFLHSGNRAWILCLWHDIWLWQATFDYNIQYIIQVDVSLRRSFELQKTPLILRGMKKLSKQTDCDVAFTKLRKVISGKVTQHVFQEILRKHQETPNFWHKTNPQKWVWNRRHVSSSCFFAYWCLFSWPTTVELRRQQWIPYSMKKNGVQLELGSLELTFG